MFDEGFDILAVAFPDLTAWYWIALIVGGGLLLLSTLAGGGGDAGIDADAGLDVDVDGGVDVGADGSADLGGDVHTGHGHAGSLASWFSMQFLVFFTAVFGLVGLSLTYLSDQAAGAVFAAALFGGLLFGQGVHQVLRSIRRTSGDSTPQAADYVNKIGRVTVRVTPKDRGEVAVHLRQGERFIPAVSQRPDATFSPGDQVAVVSYDAGTAQVISREEYEFLSDKR